MSDEKQNRSFDSYRIEGKTYLKDTYLGPKTWNKIQIAAPGRFVDILEAKFSDYTGKLKIDVSK